MVCLHNKQFEELSEVYSFTDFATAGQDGYALVSLLACFIGRYKLNELQLSAFPVPKSTIHLADAAAIKVCSL